jgi:hypothetical protein
MLPVHRPSTRPLHAGLSACLILALVLAALVLPGINPPAVQADTLYAAVPVSDVGTGNSLAEPNSSRMVAISSDGTIYVAYRGTSGVRVARSTNRGQSFAPSVQISPDDVPASIAVDANGLVYVAYVTAGQIMFSRSTDGGQTFSTPVSVGTSTAGSIDIAVDAPYVYILPQNGVKLLVNDNNGVGSFTARSTGLPSLVFSGILVDPESRDLFVIGDNPQLYYVRSAAHGVTWDSVVNPSGSVLYSTYIGGFGSIGQQVYIAGTGTAAFLIDLNTSDSSPRTFGNNLVYTGRTLAVDGEGSVIDGYSNGMDVFYAVSTDTGVTFDPPVRVATGATRMELAINPLFQDVVVVYEKNGRIYASTFASEIPPPAPVVTNPIADAQTSDATPTFSGTATADSIVTVAGVEGSITFCVAIADASGAWSCTPTTALSDGNYTVNVTAATLAGSSSPTTVSFGVDATPPAPPIVTSPAAGAQFNTGTPVFSGTTTDADGITVMVRDDTSLVCIASVSGGAWTCAPAYGLADGDYTLEFTANDAVGNTSTPVSRSIRIDTTPPAPPVITSPAEGAQLNTSTPTFSGTAMGEDGGTVTVEQDGMVLCTAGISAGAWSCAATVSLADDDYTLDVTATDAVGNRSTPASRTITIDTTAPAPPVVTSPAEGAQLNSSTPTFSGTAVGEDGGTVTVEQNGTVLCTANVSAGNWSCVSAPLSDGDQNLAITVEDVAGNLSSPTDHSITIDTIAPADPPTIISPTDGDWLATARPTFTGSANDAEGGMVTVKNGAVTLCSAPVSGGTWNCQATSDLADGPYNLPVTLSDAVGNVGPNATLGINIDTTAPAPPVVDNPADGALLGDDRPTFSGSATGEAGGTVTVRAEGTDLCVANILSDGSWICTAERDLGDGTHSVRVQARDIAGNRSTEVERSFSIDTSLPDTPVITSSRFTNMNTPVFTGTAEDGMTVELGIDLDGDATADLVYTGIPVSAGEWSLDTAGISPDSGSFPSAGLNDGDYRVEVLARSAASNVGNSARQTLVVDQTAPEAPQVNSPNITNDTTPVFSGTGEFGAVVTFSIDLDDDGTADLVYTTTVDSNGNWSINTGSDSATVGSFPGSGLIDNSYNYTAVQTDPAGNQSDLLTDSLTVDTTPPAMPTLSSPAEGKPVKANLNLTGSAEPDSTVTVTIDQDGNPATTDDSITFTTTADSAGTWQVDTTSATPTSGDWGAGLSDGMTPSITVTASDAAGNVSSPLYRIPTGVDTTAPAKPDALPDIVYQSRPTFTGSVEANATVQIWIDGNTVCETVADASGAWSCTPTTDLADGEHSARIVVIDEMGYQSSTDSIMTVDTSTRRTNQLFLPLIRR